VNWVRDPAALKWIALRFLPALALLNLAWETAQLPLYTLWDTSPVAYLVFVVLHCTAGDVLIGVVAVTAALIVMRAGPFGQWSWIPLAGLTAFLSTAYTIYSEWVNTVVYGHWEYSERMPVLTLDGFALGLSPLLQWIVLPPLAVLASRARRAETEPTKQARSARDAVENAAPRE
jgi:hypothetical protein